MQAHGPVLKNDMMHRVANFFVPKDAQCCETYAKTIINFL